VASVKMKVDLIRGIEFDFDCVFADNFFIQILPENCRQDARAKIV